MNLYNRMMDADFAYQLLSNKDYIFLYAKPVWNGENEAGDLRGECVKDKLKPFRICEIEYVRYGVSKEGKIEEGFWAEGYNLEREEFKSLRKKDMYLFLKRIYLTSKKIVVDFTLLNNRFLGAFCALLNMFDWQETYFCYTEPGKYNRNKNDDFDLKNSTMGFDQIPSLETFSDSSTECDWVVFLGFEGSRLMRLEEESPSSRRYSIPYISIPAMKTHWHNYALEANRQFFELKFDNREKLDFVSAINPFETYQRLINIHNNNADVRLVISPIGTKPVMLGCLMYVLENENEMLLFDNPYQEGTNTIHYGNSYFYDLTQFVRSVKNKRYEE